MWSDRRDNVLVVLAIVGLMVAHSMCRAATRWLVEKYQIPTGILLIVLCVVFIGIIVAIWRTE